MYRELSYEFKWSRVNDPPTLELFTVDGLKGERKNVTVLDNRLDELIVIGMPNREPVFGLSAHQSNGKFFIFGSAIGVLVVLAWWGIARRHNRSASKSSE